MQTPPAKFIGPKQTVNSDDEDDFVDMTKYQQNQTKSFSDQDVTRMREGGSPFLFDLQSDSRDENDEGDGNEPYQLSSRERKKIKRRSKLSLNKESRERSRSSSVSSVESRSSTKQQK